MRSFCTAKNNNVALSAIFSFSLLFAWLSPQVEAQTTPSPSITLTASASEVAINRTARISFKVSDATRCVASGPWKGEFLGDKTKSGSVSSEALIQRVNTFVLDCQGPGGTASRSVTVLALPAPVVEFSSDRDRAIPGESVRLTWVARDAQSCSASGAPFTGTKPTSGSETLSGLTKGIKKFALSCRGVGGTTRANAEVAVVPAPTLDFTARATQLPQSNSGTQLKWKATDATSCVASGDWSGEKGLSGTAETGSLSTEKTYTLSCVGLNGDVEKTLTVEVVPAPTVSLSLSDDVVAPGESVRIRWDVTDAQSCSASGAPFSGTKNPTNAEEVLSGLTKGTKSFKLTCKGGGGTTVAEAKLTVIAKPSLTFSASKTQIAENTGTLLKWKSTDATSCVASDDWSGEKGLSGTAETGLLVADKIYTLKCVGLNGEVEQTVTVEVVPAPVVELTLSDDVVAPGESVLISWEVTDAQTCTASGAPFSGSKNPTGSSETLSNLTKGAKTFKLTCKGGGGTTAAEAKMTVIAKPTLEFSARASQLPQTNTGTQLKWKATDATACTASGAWSGAKDPSGTFDTGVLTNDFNEYGLQCTGLNGEVSKLVTVEVVPAPVITLELSKEVVAPGESVKIFWSVTDAKSCSATGAPFTGNKDPEGGEEVLSGLTKGTKTFKLTCQGGGGSISADVKLPVFPPPTLQFTAGSTKLGQNNKGTLLRWKTTDATSCVASGAWGDSRGTGGTFETGILSREINDFELTCVGVNGEITKTISIEVFPPPFIEFELSANFIEPNDSVELIWSSLYAESCSATGAPWSGSKPLSGNETLSGLSRGNKLFKLTCTGPGGTEFIERPLAVFPIPTITGFAPAKSEVMTGSSTTLSWQSDGTDSCTASGDWTGPKPTSTPEGGSPTPTLIKGTYVFRLLCKGPGGEASAETRVGVIGTPKTEFSSTLSLLATGQSAVLKWQSADAARCEASGDWSGSKPLSGEESVSSNSARTLNFKLRCTNEKGDLFDEKSLSIEVIQPVLKITPLALAFDPRAVGSESNPRILSIENTSRVPVNLGSPILEGDVDDFVFQNTESCGDTLPPLGSCSVKVSFKPQVGGNRSLRARVPTNGAAAPILLEFSGVGLAPKLTISTSRLEFGVVAVGATSEGKKITLKNEGTASSRVDNVDLTGDATAYSVKSACAAVLDPNATCEIVVTFAPKSSGEKPGSVIVSSGSVKLAVSLWGYAQSSPNRNETSLKNSLVALPGVIASVAGSGPIALDGDGGPAVKAGVLRVGSIAVAGNGDVMFVDGYFIRRVERATGLIRSVAGTGSLFFDGDGRAATATSMAPGRLIVGSQGDLYFVDRGTRIRRIDSAGVVTTIAGTGEAGNTGDGGPATAAKILVADMVRDGEGSLYFADPQNAKIRKISATGIISTLSLTNVPSGFLPSTLAVNPSGVLHVYDQRNLQVWRVDPQTSALSLVAGTGTRGLAGDGGSATAAQLFNLGDLAFDSTGNLYLSDINVRVINASTGVIKTIALGTATSPGLPTLGGLPREVLVIANGKLLVGVDRSDLGLQIKAQIVSLDVTSLAVTVVAGRNEQAGYAGDGGSATAARIYAPTGLTLDAQGNLFIGDRMNGRVRRVDAQTGVISTLATGEPNSQTFGLRYPTYTAVAPNGDVYYSEWRGNRVMKYSPKTETVSVVAGTGTAGFTGDGGPATSAQISQPWGLAVDEQGNLYVGTSYRIRKIDPSGVITTIAGCCDGPSTPAEIESLTTPIESVVATSTRILNSNIQLAHSKGKLLFSDFSGGLESADVLRELDLTSGRVRRIAGNGTQGQTLFKGQALNSPFGQLFGVAADGSGNWYVSDVLSNTISRINPTSGEIQTIAGGRQGYDGDGGTALGAALNTPQGLAFDRRGNLYFADRSNQLVRVILCAAPPEAGEVSDCEASAPSTSRRRTLVQWNQVGVDQCEAVGAWSGPRAISGAEWLSVPSSGEQAYALRCTKADGSVSLLENVIKDGVVTSKLPKTAKLDQTSLFFGQTLVGQVSSTQTLRVQNTGSNALTVEVGLVGAGAASFTTTSCGTAIVAGGSCEIRVAFAPKSSGEQVAQVEVKSGLLKLLATVSGNGNLPVSRDQAQIKISSVPPRGVIATVAGSGPAAIEGDGGLAVKAGVSDVGAMVFASNGDVLFVDGYYIRRVERATGLIRRFAGTGSRFFDGDGRVATATAMAPGRLIVSSQGDVYFADQASRIRRIDSAGVVTTIAGTGEAGNTGDGGPATSAKILVADMARDAAGNLFFADPEAAKIRKISATGEISTLSLTNVPSGFVPSTLAVNPSGVLHVYDQRNFRLWRVDPQTSALSLVAGTGTQGLAGDGGPATAAQLYNLGDVAFDSAGNLYLSDANVRSINVSTGVITTIAFGTASSSSLPTLGGFPGPLLASSNGQLLIGSGIGDGFQISAQMFNLDLSSKVLTLVAGRGDRAGFAGDGGRATSARFYGPTSVVADAQGNLFIGDRLNGRVRRIDAQTGLVSTVAAGAPTSPTIGQRFPTFTAVAANGDVYYSEWRGHRVMKYSPQTQSVTVVAGTGTAGFSGDGGQATAARLVLPWGLAFDEQQNLYISTDGRIRRVAANGIITTVAGCCDSISDAVTPLDGVPALSARLNGGISQLAYRNGKLYFADAANGAIANPVVRELDLASGLIRTIAGNGTFGQSLTNGRALNSPLGQIFGVTTDSSGNVYISETTSSRISRINPTSGEIRAIAGGRLGYEGDGGSALDAALYTAQGISFDRRGNLYFADRANHLIRVVLCAAPPESGEVSDCDPNATPSANRRVLVQWNQTGVDQCEAVGAWSGPRAISGAEWLSVPSSGEQAYALRCTKSDGSISLHEATINGTTIVEKPLISARLSGNSLTFGTVRVGESSAVQKLTLTNSGSQPIALDTITKTGDGADAFLIESRCGSALAAGSSCEIDVTFKPNSSGDKRAQLVAGSGSLKLSANLSGSAETPPATAGSISVSTSSLVFGSVRVGSFSWTRSVIVKNVGASPVSVTSSILGLAADEMTVGNTSCLSSINAGAECSLDLTLRPKSLGSKQGQLRLATSTGELIVELRGRAGQSENQFICRADPAQTEPLPATGVLDITANSKSNSNAATQEFWLDQTPFPEASSYQVELKWEVGGANSSTLTWGNIASSATKSCARLTFSVTPSSEEPGLQSTGPCEYALKVPFVSGSSKALMRVTTGGRTVSDSVVIGNSKPDKTPLVASGGVGRVSLTWLRVEDATDYVLYKIEGATATPIAETAEPFKDLNDLVEGTSYTFAVKARSSAGSSAFSNPVTVTPRSVMAVNVQIDDIVVNQAVEIGTGATTKLIAGKPGIVQAYLKVSGDVVGHLGYLTLEAPGLETISMVGPLMDTPVSTGAGASCVATFDLRDDASTWFASGSRSLKAQAQLVSTSPPTPVSASKVFTFVDERPLYVKLIPVNSVRGNPTSAEIELAKTSIEKQLKAMYPNRSPQIVLSAAPYQFTGTDPGSNFLGELLPKIRDVRSAELSNAGCDRFYYGLHKDNKSLGSRTVGLAYTPPVSSVVANSCPPLAGVGVIEYPGTVDTTAHEIGHNHGRIHVASSGETNDNCGAPDNADSGYPYLKGRIGVTGYDSAEHRSLSKNLYHDIMSYCSRNWISDYQYRALRTFQEALSVLAPASASMVDARMSAETGGVLFSGAIDVQGVWRLGSRLALGGRRAVAADASRGFVARLVLTDGTEQTLPLEIVDIDHTAQRDFSIWLPNDLAAKEIVVRSLDGSVVFRLDVSTERMASALSTEAGYRVVGSTVEILPWGSGDRLVIRVRGNEREFVTNDGGSETLRLAFKPGDVFEVVATTTERRILIGPLDGDASSRLIDSSSAARVVSPVVTGDSSTSGGSAGSNSASQSVVGAPSVTSTQLDSSATTEDGPAMVSAFETSVSEDPMTGSRYVLSRSTQPGIGGYAWVLGYRSGSGALLNQWGLRSTAGVLWRRDDTSRLLGTSGWVAVCSNRVWVIRDGYQLLAGRTDLGLINRSESEIRVGLDEPAKVVESVSCGGGGRGLTVTGYALPVSADSPALRSGSVAATRFEVNLDEAGLPSGERSEISEFDLDAYCANPVAAERQSFCIQARN
jgi:sugar lactone lactonase YvrE